MSWISMRGTSGWKVCRWSSCGDCHPAKGVGDGWQARQWIDRQRDPLLMGTLRRSLFTPPGIHAHLMSDDEVVQSMTQHLGMKMVHVCEKEVSLLLQRTEGHSLPGGESTAPPVSRSTAPPPTTPAPRQQDQPSFGKEADLVALAGVLKSASETGTPFCEECAKAAAAAGEE
ncbi:MAG: hypothetical protein JNK48_00630 [Bryobacterales bacterium]|nr:hypothetical protein [Bryobacterales bacterium]